MSSYKTVFGSVTLFSADDIYPATIVPARYGGTYEGAPWLAFPTQPHNLPEGWDGGDIECCSFYAEHRDNSIGRGSTPNAALADLRQRILDASG